MQLKGEQAVFDPVADASDITAMCARYYRVHNGNFAANPHIQEEKFMRMWGILSCFTMANLTLMLSQLDPQSEDFAERLTRSIERHKADSKAYGHEIYRALPTEDIVATYQGKKELAFDVQEYGVTALLQWASVAFLPEGQAYIAEKERRDLQAAEENVALAATASEWLTQFQAGN